MSNLNEQLKEAWDAHEAIHHANQSEVIAAKLQHDLHHAKGDRAAFTSCLASFVMQTFAIELSAISVELQSLIQGATNFTVEFITPEGVEGMFSFSVLPTDFTTLGKVVNIHNHEVVIRVYEVAPNGVSACMDEVEITAEDATYPDKLADAISDLLYYVEAPAVH